MEISVTEKQFAFTLSNTLIKAYFDHRNFDSVNQPLVYLNMLYFDIKRVSVI